MSLLVICVLGAFAIALAGVLVVYYNLLVRRRNRVDNAWHQIGVQLNRRHDLVPALVETVKGYVSQERNVFEEAARSRSWADRASGPGEQGRAEKAVSGSFKELFAVSEEYPDIKSSQDFLDLQEELARTETRIAGARKYYNGAVMYYDNSRQGFPGSAVARLFKSRFPDREYFEAEMPYAEEVPLADPGSRTNREE